MPFPGDETFNTQPHTHTRMMSPHLPEIHHHLPSQASRTGVQLPSLIPEKIYRLTSGGASLQTWTGSSSTGDGVSVAPGHMEQIEQLCQDALRGFNINN